MANCISCGKEAGKGQFFCPECLTSMTPEQQHQASAAKPAPAAPPAPVEELKPVIDPARSQVLTAASQKKAIKADVAAAEKTSRKKSSKVAEKAGKTNKVGEGLKRTGGKLWSSIKAVLIKLLLWLKGLAFKEKCPLDRMGWISWAAGAAGVLVLTSSIFFMSYFKFEWILTGSEAIVSESTTIKGMNMGFWGGALVFTSLLMALLYAWSLLAKKLQIETGINPDFLAACAGIIGVVLVILTVGSDSILKEAVIRNTGLPPYTFEVGGMDFARDSMLYGPYVSVISLVVVFMASAARLAERGVSVGRMKSIAGRLKPGKKRGTHAR